VPSFLEWLPVAIALGAIQPAPAAAVPAAPDDRPGVSVRLERRSGRFDYHVENPSNFNPGPLVPHFFEQRYDADNTWVIVKGHYRLGGSAAATEVGITPPVTTAGSDVDTFFEPSGDVITSGTRGTVRLRMLSIQQWFEMTTWRAWRLGITAAYRRADMDFLPSDRIVTHSQPPSETREPVGGDETTWSHVIASGVTASSGFAVTDRWRLLVDLEAMPLTRARLNISLPLKYPGEIIRQDTFGFGARGRLAAERRSGRWSAGGAVTLGGAWGYQSSARYHERLVGGDVFVRLMPG
jgi:hypothetical protein